MNDGGKVTVGCTALLIAMPISAVLRGWVLSVIWGWFVVGQFHVAPIRIPFAIGLSIIVSLFSGTGDIAANQKADSGKSVGDIVSKAIGRMLAAPLFALGFAWFVQRWI